MKRTLSVALAIVLVYSTLTMGASAANNSKTFTLKSGDSMTISNYVEETREEMVIQRKMQTVTCYSMNDSTEITFSATHSGTFGGAHDYRQDGFGNTWSTRFYMGDSQNPWRTLKMDGLFQYITRDDESGVSYAFVPYTEVFIADIDNKGEDGSIESVAIYLKMDGVNTSDSTNANTGIFTDVASDAYYADAVKWAVEKKVTAGTSATTFSPDATCTNGQILTFLWRASGQPEPTVYSELEIDEEGLGTVKVNGTLGYVGSDSPLLNADIMAGVDTSGSFYLNPFTDVKTSDYYYKAALWASEKGLIEGTTLGADAPCTRSMVVTYLWKLAGSPEQAPIAGLSDVSSSAEYAVAVAWAVEQGITAGTSKTTFAPDTTCTRGQIATFLYRDLA